MKILKATIFTCIITLLFASNPIQLHAVTTVSETTFEKEDNNSLIGKVKSFFSKVKKSISKKLKSLFPDSGRNNLILTLYGALLVVGGVLLAFGFIVLGILFGFGGAGTLGLVFIILGVFLPIIILYLSFRPILKNHYKRMEKDVPQRRINLFSFFFSFIPAILGLIWLVIQNVIN